MDVEIIAWRIGVSSGGRRGPVSMVLVEELGVLIVRLEVPGQDLRGAIS